MRPTVYLAGPIAGLTYEEWQDWRTTVIAEMCESGIDAYSPLRGKAYLLGLGALTSGDYGHVNPLSSARGVMMRDHTDCTRRDLVLVNLLNAPRVSLGTVMEVAWAYGHRVPCVIAMEDGNVHDHIMLREAGLIVPTLDDAVFVAKRMLLP